MRLAAVLILTLASSVALADSNFNGDAGVSIFDFGTFAAKAMDAGQEGVDRTRQPLSGYQHDVADGVDWPRSPASDSSGFIYDGDDSEFEFRRPAPGVLDTMMDEDGGM